MKRLFRSLAICFAPYFVFVFYLMWRGPQFIAGMPRWVWWVALLYFFVALIVVGATSGRRKATAATREAKPVGTTTRVLKGGLILYVLIFLNGAGLAIRGKIPFGFAVPGLAVDALLIALFLWLLSRQRKTGKGEGNSSMASG